MKDEITKTEMLVKGLVLDPVTNMPMILLKENKGRQTIPIWVGILEASSIAAQLDHTTLSRTGTHDLMAELIDSLGGKLLRVEITDLRDNTFYGKLYMKKGRTEISLDARPSDAIALSLKSGIPIFVTEKVVKKAKLIDLSGRFSGGREGLAGILENLTPEAFGKYKM